MQLIGIISGVITSLIMYKIMFSDRDDFIECVKFWFTPDIVSMFRGDYWNDHWAELKLLIWLGASVAVAYGVSNL